jgi:hypothetical protein
MTISPVDIFEKLMQGGPTLPDESVHRALKRLGHWSTSPAILTGTMAPRGRLRGATSLVRASSRNSTRRFLNTFGPTLGPTANDLSIATVTPLGNGNCRSCNMRFFISGALYSRRVSPKCRPCAAAKFSRTLATSSTRSVATLRQ